MSSTVARIRSLAQLSVCFARTFARRNLTRELHGSRNRFRGYLKSRLIRYSNENNSTNQTLAGFTSNRCSTCPAEELTAVEFEKISNETLDSLTEYFDELVEQSAHLPDADVSYGDGVLTVKFGEPHGTYVINRQTPNKQIWLSSPKSGPKRYDFIDGKWIYKHDGKSLHKLLNDEISTIVKTQVCFDKCSFSGKETYSALDTV